MKVGVIGCGALGSYYGSMLAREGAEVHFLLRSDYEVVRRQGVQIRSPKGDFTARPRCATHSQQIGICDLVLIGLKTTANDQLSVLLPPLVDSRTAVLTLQNGLGNEAVLAQFIPVEQIMGGLCFVCLNRVQPGIIHHLAHGRIVLGEYQRWPEPRTHAIAEMFRHAGVPCTVTANLEQAHWEKLVWNIPFNGLGVAGAVGIEPFRHREARPRDLPATGPCLTTDQLLGDAQWSGIVRVLMLEVIAAARALGFKIEEDYADQNIERTRVMGAYKASTLIDYERGQPLELASLFLEPLKAAQRTGVSTPHLAALCEVLKKLDARLVR